MAAEQPIGPDPSPKIAPEVQHDAHTPSSLGVGLTIVGAIAVGISVFLPLDESPGGVEPAVPHNSLIQHGGWLFLLVALGVVLNVARASQGRARATRALGCTIAGVALLIALASDKSLRTVHWEGRLGFSGNELVSFGPAVYVTGVGLALALVGSWITRQSLAKGARQASSGDGPMTTRCPDCSETILTDANVCKHCGYRFADPQVEVQAPPSL